MSHTFDRRGVALINPPCIEMHEADKELLEPLAVVGFSFKFPQDADSVEGLWNILEERRDVATSWPHDRMNFHAFHPDNNRPEAGTFIPGAHFLKEDLGAFDASFFGVNATEAASMDCQHRILLETTYHAIENAGITMEKISGSKTGVYTGSMADDYQHVVLKDIDNIPRHAATGVAQCMTANRLSWFYNLHGPSINLDSACSSSLMALDFACQGLRNRDCDTALVTGSSLVLAAETTISLNNMNMLSPHGQSFSFDARADGYSRGEGFSAVVVKRLSDALLDGNTIRAVVRSTGSNQDGYTPGVTQPSRDLQARLIKETYEKAGLRLDQTRFFEAHGTGTSLGDPIEADAIGSTFRQVRSETDPLYVGALKSNIGHLEGGSGLAGMIKTILVLEKGTIPPNANFESVNPKIDAKLLNIKFPTECIPWPSSGLRRASVASFGFGGSNSHVIMDDALHYLKQRSLSGNHNTSESVMEETHRNGVAWNREHNFHSHKGLDPMPTAEYLPERCLESCGRAGPVALRPVNSVGAARDGALETMNHSYPRRERLLVISAADESGIKRIAAAYEHYFRSHPVPEHDDVYLDRLAHTLTTHRTSMPWRSFAVLKNTGSLEEIGSLMSKPSPPAAKQGAKAFIFTGQGAQYRRMGVQLFKHAVFKESIDAFDRELRVLGCSWSVAGLLREEGPVEHDLDDPQYSQPATTALQIALYEFMCALDATPDVVLGHSSGEIAAAFAAGALSLHSACKASFERGRLASGLKRSTAHPGAMLAVDISEEEMHAFIEKDNLVQGTLCVACINSPCNVTVAGDESDIDLLQEHLQHQDIRARKLATGVAYHSPHMSAIAMEYEQRLSGLTRPAKSTTSPSMISSVTGQYIRDVSEVCKPSYWAANLVSPVQFAKALSVISQSIGKAQTRKLGAAKAVKDIRDLIEIGPHSALRRPVLDNLIHHEVPDAKERYHSVLVRTVPASQSALQLIGELFARGYPVNVQSANLLRIRTSSKKPQLLIDLPSYPFNHSKSYWHESTISQHARVRRAPKQELLGVPVSDWNPMEPRWRKFLDVSETPWKGEHVVNGKAIYPATGMVVMAIEAAKQSADPARQISGYRIQDAIFLAPIPVEEDRSEVQLHMRSNHAHPVDKSTSSFEFRVYCTSSTGWFENCHGFVQVVYENDRHDDQGVRRRENSFFCNKFNEAQQLCVHHVPTKRMYDNFISNGVMYGPAFQGLDNLHWNGKDIAIGDVQCFKWVAEQSHNARQSHVAHPTTLDAAGQLAWVALTEGATKTLANGFAVTRVQYMWLANSGLTYPRTDHIRVWNKSAVKGLRGTDCSVFALNDAGELVMEIRHFETTSVGGSDTAAREERTRDICYEMVYKPDLSLMDAKQLSCATTLGDTVDEAEIARFYQDLEAALFYLAKKTRDATSSLDPSQTLTRPHMTRYLTWLDRQIRRYEVGDLTWRRQGWTHETNDSSEMETLIDRLESANEQGRLFMRLGRTLFSIVQGIHDPLAVIFESGLAEHHYQEVCDEMPCSKQATKYLELLSHKNPNMSVLEVGAGTGSMTGRIIEGLRHRFSQYVYTDISQAYFEAAREKFATFESKMTFRLLDVEKDAVEQGYQAESYDLVVAAWVLHATRDLASTIRHVRRLLKPRGKLILVEITEPEILRNGFIFGTLPGWWSGLEPERKWGPCVPGPKWSQLLLDNGFESVDLVLHDYEGPICRENSIIIASRDGSECLSDAAPTTTVTLLLGDNSQPQTTVAKGLRSFLEHSEGIHCQIADYMDETATRDSPNSTLVFLAELHQPCLSALNGDSFQKLKALLSSARLVIWLAHSCKRSALFPDTEMVKGLARVLCTEKPSLRFVTLKFESSLLEAQDYIRLASQVITATLRDSYYETRELEYVEREGALLVNRVYSSDQLNKEVHAKNHSLLTDRTIQQSPPLALKVPDPGLLDSLRWEADLSCAQSQTLEDDEIEIEVQAIGVNFRDLLVVLGRVNASTVGCECAGVVVRTGANCSSRFRPGDRVCAGVLGCARTRVRCHLDLAVKVPPFLSVKEAAALPITGVTAYYSLVTLANLQREDSILIHSATGGTGQMALQLAQSIGAQTFVTVGTEKKRKLLMESFGVPEENILYSRDTSFARELLRRTDGRGVDVVLNSLSGSSLLASWECVAPFGRFIELGKADIQANSNLPMSRFFGEISFHAVAVDYIVEHRPALFQKQLQAVINLLQDKKIKVASPLNLYSISNIESAFRNMQSGRNIGKMVLTLSPSDVVPTWLPPSYSCHLDPNVSYLIAGGLGGLGRSAARWMAQRGARHLILLSRSGPVSHAAQILVKELEGAGVTIRAPQCDVSNSDSLVAALDQCMDMPPIKGCLQGTMVLQDSLFESMTWDQWLRCIRSKVPSTWNLHSHLPRDLSFFIMLSSAAGIVGSMGQSNYAAGNTYQDGLAAHRLALGEKALSIDLGWMGDVGIVAENANLARGKEAIADLAPVFETEFLALLDRFCDPDIIQSSELSQIVIGLVTPAQLKSKALEPPDWLVERPIFKGLPRDTNEGSNGGAEGVSAKSDRIWAEELGRASSITQAKDVVIEALKRKLSKAASISQEEIDTKKPLHVYGVDSLLAVELRNWFAKVLKADLAIFDITGQGSVEEVAEHAATRSSLVTSIPGVL